MEEGDVSQEPRSWEQGESCVSIDAPAQEQSSFVRGSRQTPGFRMKGAVVMSLLHWTRALSGGSASVKVEAQGKQSSIAGARMGSQGR